MKLDFGATTLPPGMEVDELMRVPKTCERSLSSHLSVGTMIFAQGNHDHHYHHQPQLPGSIDTSRQQFTSDHFELFSVKQESASFTLLPLRSHDSSEVLQSYEGMVRDKFICSNGSLGHPHFLTMHCFYDNIGMEPDNRVTWDLLIPVITDKNKSFYYHASLEVEGIVYVGLDPSGFV
ncbi:hypothetical protein JHK85_045944 [Glycine max]|nr:hypothetical protein JHK86_045360 [Glycine max]KAG4952077.1 hypothetical protein JHK85_045944 [Glycine max]